MCFGRNNCLLKVLTKTSKKSSSMYNLLRIYSFCIELNWVLKNGLYLSSYRTFPVLRKHSLVNPPRETLDSHSPAFCNCIHCAGPRTSYKWIQSIYTSVCHSFHYMFLRLLHITVYICKSEPSLLFHNIPLYGPTTVCLTLVTDSCF